MPQSAVGRQSAFEFGLDRRLDSSDDVALTYICRGTRKSAEELDKKVRVRILSAARERLLVVALEPVAALLFVVVVVRDKADCLCRQRTARVIALVFCRSS